MTTLEQLLNNFRHAAISSYTDGYYGTVALKAAQEAIVAHVEGAMGDAKLYGNTMGVDMASGQRRLSPNDWDNLVGRWV